MIRLQNLSVFWFLTTVVSCAHAQEISGITVDQTTLLPKTPISIQVNFNLAGIQNPYCGLEISFGDGETQTVRAGLDGAPDFPLRLSHTYANPGKFAIKVEGKTVIRGFKTASACQGTVKQHLITIVDVAAEKAKDELERKERALAAKQKELEQSAERLAKDQNEQALRAQRLQAQELAQKQREIEQRERILEQKQREIEQRERQAQGKNPPSADAKAPVPAKQNPPPTPGRKGVEGF